jgi:hypothetical protein
MREACNATLSGVSVFPAPAHVVVVGDVHGDLAALERCLQLGGLVGANGHWAALDTTLVVLGDVVDRWRGPGTTVDTSLAIPGSIGEVKDEELLVVRRLNSLAEDARAHGSCVIRLVGNHELMQAEDYRSAMLYSSPFSRGGLDSESAQRRVDSFRQGPFHVAIGDCQPKAVVQIGSTVFCHGGINVDQINYANGKQKNLLEFANDVLTDLWEHPVQPGEYTVKDRKALLIGAGPGRGRDPFSGFLWDDSLSHAMMRADVCSRTSSEMLAKLNENLRAYPARGGYQRVERIAVSHHVQGRRSGELLGQVPGVESVQGDVRTYTTVGAETRFIKQAGVASQGINTECDGRVWRVDVGMSRAFLQSPFSSLLNQTETMRARAPAVLIIDDDGAEFTIKQSVTPLPGQEPYLIH